MNKVKLAVVGCGAQAELSHLPAIALSDKVELVALVDKNLSQARRLAESYDVSMAIDDYNDIVGRAEAAVLVLPNNLHAPIAVDLLRQGIHVLVEKPMAVSTVACEQMIATADAAGVQLAVGLDFRFVTATRFVRQAMKGGLLGQVIRFDLRMGDILPASYVIRSDYIVRKDAAGGGVLIDLGVHALDLILWWFGDYDDVAYHDDSMGGVEANALLDLSMKSGAQGTVELSRFRRLRNSCVIEGERGSLEVGVWTGDGLLDLKLRDHELVMKGQDVADKSWRQIFCLQIDDFADAIRANREPFVPGRQGKRSVELVEACYAARQPLTQPWMFPERHVVGVS